MSDIKVGSATINELGAASSNFQQYISKQNMFDPSNIAATSYTNCDVYFYFNYVDDLFQNPGSPSATMPSEHSNELVLLSHFSYCSFFISFNQLIKSLYTYAGDNNIKSPNFGDNKFS